MIQSIISYSGIPFGRVDEVEGRVAGIYSVSFKCRLKLDRISTLLCRILPNKPRPIVVLLANRAVSAITERQYWHNLRYIALIGLYRLISYLLPSIPPQWIQ